MIEAVNIVVTDLSSGLHGVYASSLQTSPGHCNMTDMHLSHFSKCEFSDFQMQGPIYLSG